MYVVDCDGRGVSLEGGGEGDVSARFGGGGGAGCVWGWSLGKGGWFGTVSKSLEGRMDGDVSRRDEGKVR